MFAKKWPDGRCTDIANRTKNIYTDGCVDIEVSTSPPISMVGCIYGLDANNNWVCLDTVDDILIKIVINPKVLASMVLFLNNMPNSTKKDVPTFAKDVIAAAATRINTVINNRTPIGTE